MKHQHISLMEDKEKIEEMGIWSELMSAFEN